MGNASTFCLLDITNRWRQPEETHSKYADLSKVAYDIFSILPHGVGVEASFSIGQDVSSWRQSKTTAQMVREKVVVGQFAPANDGILQFDCEALDAAGTDNDLE